MIYIRCCLKLVLTCYVFLTIMIRHLCELFETTNQEICMCNLDTVVRTRVLYLHKEKIRQEFLGVYFLNLCNSFYTALSYLSHLL